MSKFTVTLQYNQQKDINIYASDFSDTDEESRLAGFVNVTVKIAEGV